MFWKGTLLVVARIDRAVGELIGTQGKKEIGKVVRTNLPLFTDTDRHILIERLSTLIVKARSGGFTVKGAEPIKVPWVLPFRIGKNAVSGGTVGT